MDLLGAQPTGDAGAIEGHAASADYRQPLADLVRGPKVHAAQKANGVIDFRKIFSGNPELSAFVGARGNYNGVKVFVVDQRA